MGCTGLLELQAILKHVQPETVYLFGLNPEIGSTDAFLKRLAGLAKYAVLQRQGQVDLAVLVRATAQTELAVRVGLAWLVARSYIEIVDEEDRRLQLVAGSAENEGGAGLLQEQLNALLVETAAYRAYFRKAEPSGIVQ